MGDGITPKKIAKVRKSLRRKLRDRQHGFIFYRFINKFLHPRVEDWIYHHCKGFKSCNGCTEERLCMACIEKAFRKLGEKRSELWKSSPDPDKARDHAIEEVKLLRSEILDIKNREIMSERFFSGGAIAVYVGFGKQIITQLFFLWIPIIFSIFGLLRFREYQRNMLEIDCYLRELECALRCDVSWVGSFFSNRSMNRYLQSREWFWYLVVSLCTTLTILGWLGKFETSALEIEFVGDLSPPLHISTPLASPPGR